jgi:hypothetical protein
VVVSLPSEATSTDHEFTPEGVFVFRKEHGMVDWRATKIVVEKRLDLYDLVDLIQTLDDDAQIEVVIEIMCAFSEPQQDKIAAWLKEQ